MQIATSAALPHWRLWVMRGLYLLIFVGLAPEMWAYMINWAYTPGEPIAADIGVADAFWTALSTLALLGVRFPLTMLPLLLLQFAYKFIWLIFVAWPLYGAGALDPTTDELFRPMAIGIVLDLLIIPWGFVAKNYFARIVDLKTGGV